MTNHKRTLTAGDGFNRVKITVEEVAYHRNGMAGESFHVVTFTYKVEGERASRPMVGIVFEYRHNANPRVAVFDRAELGKGAIAFGGTDEGRNSWRGDQFAPALAIAIKEYEASR